jgi:thiamine pyrophosphokinase
MTSWKGNRKRANIFLHGSYYDYLPVINKDYFNLASDGGISNCERLGVKADLILGDLDSLGAYAGETKVVQDPDQDSTDFDKALAYLQKEGFKKIYVYFFSGNRFDHQLAGLSSLMSFKELDITIYSQNQIIELLPLKSSLKTKPGELISIFPLVRSEKIFFQGLKWNLNGQTMEPGGLISTSNEAISERVEIQYLSGCLVLIRNWKEEG